MPDLSVVIPSYNSAPWLPSTLEALGTAVRAAGIEVEVIVVDDGSSDDTTRVVTAIAATFPGDLRMIRQSNQGRFMARWTGIEASKAERILLLDSRVLMHPSSLSFVFHAMSSNPGLAAWNAHIVTDADAPLVGRFWDVPTYIFWGDYLRAPRPFDLTSKTFDSAPKGTTAFLATPKILREAFEYARPLGDAKLVSDDTKVLRHIADTGSIRIDPAFAATYRPRTTTRAFIRHTFDRGTLFVDSYAGTAVLRSAAILAFAVAPLIAITLLALLAVLGQWAAVILLMGAAVLIALAPIAPAAINRCPGRSILAYVCYVPLFVVPFWFGLVRGVLMHRGAFGARTPSRAPHRKDHG
jgi:hypothetical protein